MAGLLSLPIAASAPQTAPITAITRALHAQVSGSPTDETDLARFYAERGFKPVWTSRTGVRPEAQDLVAILAESERDGLRPNDYAAARLSEMIAAPGPRDASALADLDLALSRAFADYVRDLHTPAEAGRTIYTDRAVEPPQLSTAYALGVLGGSADLGEVLVATRRMNPVYEGLRDALDAYHRRWSRLPQVEVPAGATLAQGARGPRVRALRHRLGASPSDSFDTDLAAAVSSFQTAHGIESTGRADSATIAAMNLGANHYERLIRANLERARGLPANLGDRYILVDAAAARLWLYEGGRPVQSMKVVVGRPETATPAMVGMMRYAVFNPYWNVPEDLVRDRIAPRYLREGQAFFDRERLEALSGWGPGAQVLDPRRIDWALVAKGELALRVRQRPGAGNMMGQVKLMLPNDLGIYLHDTPDRALFAQEVRTFSAGCVRLERAMDLAQTLVGASNSRQALQKGVETRVDLPQPVPVYITYLTAVGAQGRDPRFRSDVYGRDAALMASLDRRTVTPRLVLLQR